MKILIVNKFFYKKGGAETYFFRLIELLKSYNIEVQYFSMQDKKNRPSEYEKFFVSNINYDDHSVNNIFRASSRLLYSFEAKKNISKLLKSKPDLVHLNNIYHQLSPSIIDAIKSFNIPIVMTIHDLKLVCPSYSMINKGKICELCRNNKFFHCYLTACFKKSKAKSLLATCEMYLHHKILKIYKKIDAFIAPSFFIKKKVAYMGFRSNSIYVIPNFVQLENFSPNYNYNGNSIIYFGRLDKSKGILTLLDVVKKMQNIELKLIGQGPLFEKIRYTIRKENIKNIKLLGFLEEKPLKEEIRKCLFSVVPSEIYENNPLSIIESLALGKPVIGSRIGGIPEILGHGCGFLFEPGNRRDLAEKIDALIRNRDLAVSMGKKGRLLVEENNNQTNYFNELMKVYRRVLASNG
jgi:glycosyltransferase involved in cell wall biosynthesis